MEAAAAHRARLAEALPGRTVVIAAGEAPIRSNDTAYDFRPDSDFCWLTGCAIENAVVVVRSGDAVLYMPPPAYPGEKAFWSDARYGELWAGAAPGPEDWARALGIDVRRLSELRDEVLVDHEVARTLAALRMYKDAWEIDQLRQAVDRTVEGFAEVVREIPAAIAGRGERWLQGTFDRYARAYGNGPGYASIVGSGKHAPTLHWVRCDGPVLPEELLLLDMGVEVASHYTADVTRTFPASGRFSDAQRQVHDLVEKAHRAGLAAVGPGRDEALSDAGQQHRRYLICGIGHHLGLDVHDCAQAAPEAYQGATLGEGMVLTVEPGLYFHAHDRAAGAAPDRGRHPGHRRRVRGAVPRAAAGRRRPGEMDGRPVSWRTFPSLCDVTLH
ncbi:aminopeptidase P family protein [Actinacidiphila acidipaludis]|uniref:aminopeptidase P family protein n=1 Tax=Actinacidiphila acidipaludis TaxID=2873382 RepID=UPI0027DEEEE8|nr:Xaa-Pro aminopeptidase [Streptomyces acidipaludis]